MISPARVAAYEILRTISEGRLDLPSAVDQSRRGLVDERDRALAADIAIGVQRWRAALDHLIATFAKRPVARLDPEIVEILRVGGYQLLHLERVPASAVVDDAVNLARRAGKRSATGFVNAVLRAISRHRSHLPLPPRPADPRDRDAALDYLSVTLSHPRWLVARWHDRFGFNAAARWAEFNNRPAPLTLRTNSLRSTGDALVEALARDGVTVERGRFAPDALVVCGGHPLRTECADRGDFLVQDEASQLVALLAGPAPGPRVLDTCASPGGKTVALAAAMRNAGLLVACDVRARRMELLRRTVTKAGAGNVHFVRADLLEALPFLRPFDCVLVDAPCSGLGTLRRDPDIKWRRGEGDLAALASAQLRMLRHAADSVAPGGRLVYATCSSEPEENEQIAAAFLALDLRFGPLDLHAAGTSLPESVIDTAGHLRTLPHEHGLEAFFGAAFERVRHS